MLFLLKKFLVDSMHGKLMVYLRILGYDTIYSRAWSDSDILLKARDEGRILVTGDKNLFKKALKGGLKAVYIHPETPVDKALGLVAYITGIRLKPDLTKTRCPICNGVLRISGTPSINYRMSRGDKIFFICTKCGNTYWIGSHWIKIRSVLGDAEYWLKTLLSQTS